MPAKLTDRDYELLSAYIDGALTDAERSEVERRLDTEPDLQHELAALRQTVALVNRLPSLRAPRDYTLDASMVAQEQKITPLPRDRKRKGGSRFNYGTLGALAAAVFVIVFSAVIVLTMVGPSVGNVFSNLVGNLSADDGASAGRGVAAAPTRMATPTGTPTALPPEAAEAPSMTQPAVAQDRAPELGAAAEEADEATVEEGERLFDVEGTQAPTMPPADAMAQPRATASPQPTATAPASPTATASPPPTRTQEAEPADNTVIFIILGAIALVLVGIGAVIVLQGRRS